MQAVAGGQPGCGWWTAMQAVAGGQPGYGWGTARLWPVDSQAMAGGQPGCGWWTARLCGRWTARLWPPGCGRGQILETFSISYRSRAGPGAEGIRVFQANDMVLTPGGEDYRRGEQHLSTSWLDS